MIAPVDSIASAAAPSAVVSTLSAMPIGRWLMSAQRRMSRPPRVRPPSTLTCSTGIPARAIAARTSCNDQAIASMTARASSGRPTACRYPDDRSAYAVAPMRRTEPADCRDDNHAAGRRRAGGEGLELRR